MFCIKTFFIRKLSVVQSLLKVQVFYCENLTLFFISPFSKPQVSHCENLCFPARKRRFLDGKTYKTLWCNALFTKGFYKRKKKERAHRPSLSRLSVCHLPMCATTCSRHTGCRPSEGSHHAATCKRPALIRSPYTRNISHPEVIVLAELVDSFSGSFKV